MLPALLFLNNRSHCCGYPIQIPNQTPNPSWSYQCLARTDVVVIIDAALGSPLAMQLSIVKLIEWKANAQWDWSWIWIWRWTCALGGLLWNGMRINAKCLAPHFGHDKLQCQRTGWQTYWLTDCMTDWLYAWMTDKPNDVPSLTWLTDWIERQILVWLDSLAFSANC